MHKEQLEHRALLDQKGWQVQRELREHKGRKVTEDHKELREPSGHKGQ